MAKKDWEQPVLESLDISMTMRGSGTWIDARSCDANPHAHGSYPPPCPTDS